VACSSHAGRYALPHLYLLELDDPVVVELRFEARVGRADPGGPDPSHGTDLLGQRYAYDLVRSGFHLHPAGTLRWLLVGGRTRDLLRLGAAQRMEPSRCGVQWFGLMLAVPVVRLAIPLAIRSL
jgi:hypothetical protein